MYWTLELASYLSDAPWPANTDGLIDFAIRTGAPLEVVENLQAIEEEDEDIYESIQDIWPDFPTEKDYGMKMSIKVIFKIIYLKSLFEFFLVKFEYL